MPYAFDSEIAPILDHLPEIDLRDIDQARATATAAGEFLPAFVPDQDVEIAVAVVPATDSTPAVEVITLRPSCQAGAPAPVVVWFHGGGFVLGDARESLPFLHETVHRTGAVAVSVEYRRAPEARYPAAVDDGEATIAWLVQQAVDLGIDPDRIALGGQSAGGAYAAGLALRLADNGGPAICQLVLDIPVTDDRVDTESATTYTDTPMWNHRNAVLGWRAYLGEGVAAEPYAAPARAEDLSGMPPTFIAVNQFDPLRDEALEFARRLAHAGVPTDAHLYAGTFHGSAAIAPDAAVSRRQNNDLQGALVRALASTSSTEGESA